MLLDGKGFSARRSAMPWVVTVLLVILSTPALADSYPVSGRWTFDYSAEKGPAPQCTGRIVDFRGERRFDTGGGVPDYRNISVTPAGTSRYQIVDEIFTGQIRGHVDYTLRIIDADHIELTLASGSTQLLRRCG